VLSVQMAKSRIGLVLNMDFDRSRSRVASTSAQSCRTPPTGRR
jgi:hypothetical protein